MSERRTGRAIARGWEQLTRVNGTDDPRMWRRVEELSPDLARMIVEFGYGDCYADRPKDVLDERQRQLVTIGALAATAGCEEQLAVHVNVALEVGLTPDQVVEAITPRAPVHRLPAHAQRGRGRARRVRAPRRVDDARAPSPRAEAAPVRRLRRPSCS